MDMKGILLAGGSGHPALHPMTLAASKQSPPVDQQTDGALPVAYADACRHPRHPGDSTPEARPQFSKLLGGPVRFGVDSTYVSTEAPRGDRAGLPDWAADPIAGEGLRTRALATNLHIHADHLVLRCSLLRRRLNRHAATVFRQIRRATRKRYWRWWLSQRRRARDGYRGEAHGNGD